MQKALNKRSAVFIDSALSSSIDSFNEVNTAGKLSNTDPIARDLVHHLVGHKGLTHSHIDIVPSLHQSA